MHLTCSLIDNIGNKTQTVNHITFISYAHNASQFIRYSSN